MFYSVYVIADTMEDLEARGFCFDPLSGDPCVGLGEQRPRAFARSDDPQGGIAVGCFDGGESGWYPRLAVNPKAQTQLLQGSQVWKPVQIRRHLQSIPWA